MSPPRRSPRNSADDAKQRARRADEDRDRASLQHELQVHQEQLIARNAELEHSSASLEDARDRLLDLYEFAPNGYASLDKNGVIRLINFTGASLLGRSREAIEGLPILGFVVTNDRPRLLDLLRRARSEGADGDLTLEVSLKPETAPREVELICRPAREAVDGSRNLLVAIIDITDRRKLEAGRAAVAREHAAIASRLISAQEEERQRIARDLHDNVGQQVTALRLLLQLAAMDDGDEGMRARVIQAQGIVEQLDRQLDFITSELRPASLDLGLASAIERLVHEWSTTFGVAADVHCAELQQLSVPKDLETQLYRIVQEALNNVYKHAHARHVSVVLERRDEGLILVVEDDGRGFDREAYQREQGRGLGLLGMKERADLMGARLDIEAAPSKGTTIYVQVPAAAVSAGRTESQ